MPAGTRGNGAGGRRLAAPCRRSQRARLSPPGKPGEQDAAESGTDGFESPDSLLQSWNSQSSLLDVQRVPSFESFEDDCSQALGLGKPAMSFKDYIQERSDPAEQGKPVIPAAVLAGFTGECRSGAPAARAVPVRARRVRAPRPVCTPRRPGRRNSASSRALSPTLRRARLAGAFLPGHRAGVGECAAHSLTWDGLPIPDRGRGLRPLPLTHPLGERQRM